MRSLGEIAQANKDFEERDKAGDFDENTDNCCIFCLELVEDCDCDHDGDGLAGVDLDG